MVSSSRNKVFTSENTSLPLVADGGREGMETCGRRHNEHRWEEAWWVEAIDTTCDEGIERP